MKNEAENTHNNTTRWLSRHLGFCLLLIHFACQNSDKDAWMTYRNDNARSGITSTNLNFPLTQKWAHMPSHAPVTSWHEPAGELPRMHTDNVYHVTVANGFAFFGSPTDNKVYAIDVATGAINWTFYTEGPVRFAPTIFNDQIYVGSDDGYVYCLKAKSGKLLWKYRPGPSDEKILGVGRMISLWPVRTSILLDDGIAYFAAGIFPYEGLYICALKADDGSVVWSNNSIGDRAHELQYGGFSPQSYLVASKEVLYVPSGRALPAAFDKNTGEFLFYTNPGDPGKGGGTWTLLDGDNLVAGVDFYGTPAKLSFDGNTGEKIEDVHAWFPGIDMVTTNDISYILTETGIAAIDRQKYSEKIEAQKKLEKEEGKISGALRGLMRQKYYSKEKIDNKKRNDLDKQIDELLRKTKQVSTKIEQLKTSLFKWNFARTNLKSLILTESAIIAGGDGVVIALDIESGENIWQREIEGIAYGLAVTKGSIFVSTDIGKIFCFSEREVEEIKTVKSELNPSPYAKDKLTHIYEYAANKIVQETGVNKGYCLVLGSGTGRLAYELANRSELKIIGIENDEEKVKIAKTNLDKAGLYGSRVVVEQWKLSALPDYFANLIVSDDMLISGEIAEESHEIFRILKPYGGIAYFGQVAESSVSQTLDLQQLERWLHNPDVKEPQLDREGGQWAKMIRGELEGAGSWSQQYANPQNTANSGDKLVNGQLGVLWFGEPGPKGIVERHSRAASPVSMDGRLFVQGEEIIMAYDAYNGSLLWEKKIPGAVRSMADVDCGNLVLCENGLFVAAYDKCYHLDPATGETTRIFKVPSSTDGSMRRWGYITSNEGILYGSSTTPLLSSYAAVYNNLVEDGKWKNTGDLPAEYQSELKQLKLKYPVPTEALRKDLHRSGAFFRTMANWPRGGEHSIKGAVTNNNQSSSDKIFAFDIETGKLRWEHDGSKISNITIALGNGKIYFAESDISSAQKQTAVRERHKFIELGVYKVREGILKDLKEAETEVAHLMKNENPDPRYVDKMAYRVNTIKAEMYREENEKGILEYKDADLRIVYALDAVTGKKIWAKSIDLTGCCGDRMGTIFYDNMLFFAGNFGNHDAWRFWHGSYKWRRVMALSAENGEMQWSRALNYRTRPLFLGDKLIIEPRACDPRTGEIIMRSHPVTGKKVPWEFLRPGHTCAETSASADGLFYRSACTAFYDVTKDRGVTYFGGLREGCLINMIPASGLVMIPEASSGCVCAYPIRTTVVLKRKEKRPEPWTVFITHGPMTPVKRFAINLGAPSDYKDNAGNLWFAYPNPNTHYNNHFNNYGVKFNLQDKYQEGMGYFCNDFKGMKIEGTDNPWLFSSGCLGFSKCEIPLIDDIFGEEEGSYTLRLGFKSLEDGRIGNRIFDIKVQGEVAIKNFDLAKEAGTKENIIIKTLKGIPVKNTLRIELLSKKDAPSKDETSLINFIEILREDEIKVAALAKDESELSDIEAAKLLDKATIDLEQNQYESALQNYHLVLDMSSSNVQKQRALEGMALIASPKSLSRLRDYCRDVTPMPKGFKEYTRHLDLISFGKYKALDPNRSSTPKNKVESIVWDYNEPEAELIDGAIKVFIAIANKIAANDREKAIRMLNYTLDYANEDLRNEIVNSLKTLGANI